MRERKVSRNAAALPINVVRKLDPEGGHIKAHRNIRIANAKNDMTKSKFLGIEANDTTSRNKSVRGSERTIVDTPSASTPGNRLLLLKWDIDFGHGASIWR